MGVFNGLLEMTWQQAVMIGIGFALIYLAIVKEYEPVLLLPIGFGAIISNFPGTSVLGEHGFLTVLYRAGIITELFPLLIFIGIGAMMTLDPFRAACHAFRSRCPVGHIHDHGHGGVAEFPSERSRIDRMIGAADGPTAIYVATKFARRLLGPISAAAYSYMSLVPLIPASGGEGFDDASGAKD